MVTGKFNDKIVITHDGKVVCVANNYGLSVPVSNFTIGKVYEVVDGVITSDNGYHSKHYRTVNDLSGGLGHHFIPLVE